MDKRTLRNAQIFMTQMMAFMMSGLMSLLARGPSIEWLMDWPLQFIIAWPIAFVLTKLTWPLSMKLAARMTSGQSR